MYRVTDEWHVLEYVLLTLDRAIHTDTDFNAVSFDGERFPCANLYDAGDRTVAIKSDQNWLGREVELVL